MRNERLLHTHGRMIEDLVYGPVEIESLKDFS